MKTRCPDCQTTFRVTPEQLRARAGKVRCGQCQGVFNALDSLIDSPDISTAAHVPTHSTVQLEKLAEETSTLITEIQPHAERPEETEPTSPIVDYALSTEQSFDTPSEPEPTSAEPVLPEAQTDETQATEATIQPLSEAEAQELGKATGLILPREMTEVPGYSKWTAGVMAAPLYHEEPEKPLRWPYVVVALLLAIVLSGQMVFRFRSELAITVPAIRPALEALCEALGADIPLPRHVDLVSIEASDLQNDPARGNLLVLNATVRNRALYAQAFPALELALTDTQDNAIARRVFMPEEYLPLQRKSDRVFAANADIAVRLWIETKDIPAAGYRLYVFYP